MNVTSASTTSHADPTADQCTSLLDCISGFHFILVRFEDGVDTFEYVSANVHHYLGISVSELIENAELFLERIEPEDRFIISAALTKAEQEPQQLDIRFRIKTTSEHDRQLGVRWLRIKAVSERLAPGSFRLTGYCEDVTESQRTLTEVTQQAEQLINMVNGLPGFVYLYEKHASGQVRFPFVSERMEEVYGVHPSEVKDDAAAVWNKVHVDDLDRVAREVDLSLHDGTALDTVFRINHPRKGLIHVSVTGSCERIDATTWLIAGYAQDITVDVLREQALRDATERAERAMRAKNLFLANISHELRTPIHGTMGLVDMLRETSGSRERDTLAQKAKHSLSHLLSLVNEILDMNKLENSELMIQSAVVSVPALLTEMQEFFQLSAEQQGLFLSVEWDSRLNHSNVLIDPKRLRQILLNLIGNAIKFTESGGVAVRVFFTQSHCRNTDRQHRCLQMEITDTGVGIPLESQTLLFEPFFQVDNALRRKHEGTGLGLSICKQLVQLMGGELWVNSNPGQGSTFGFQLPVSLVAAALDESISAAATLEQGNISPSDPSLSSLVGNVLIVEDNEINQLIIENLLEKRGVDVEHAVNGLEAIEKTRANQFDLILMDIHMPEMDGLEATRRLRELQVTTPIIGLSAAVLDEEIDAALNIGMDGFLAKPLDLQELDKILANYLTILK